jgi:broad specificity phosphatase PhoE
VLQFAATRAAYSGEIVTAGLNLTIVAIDDLRECRFGIYEGRPSDSACRDEWAQGGLLPGGETHDAYLNRALKGLNTALAHPGPVLVVAHGGTFWAIQRFALNGQPVRIANCVLFRLDPPHTQKHHGEQPKWLSPTGYHLLSEKGQLPIRKI